MVKARQVHKREKIVTEKFENNHLIDYSLSCKAVNAFEGN